MTNVCILLFSNIERGNGGGGGFRNLFRLVFGNNLMFLRIFQHNLSKVEDRYRKFESKFLSLSSNNSISLSRNLRQTVETVTLDSLLSCVC